MLAARTAIILVVMVAASAQADVVTFLTQSRAVEAMLELSSAGGPPITLETDTATSDSGMFDEIAAVAEAGYSSTASQTSHIHSAGVWADSVVSLAKPLMAGDILAHQDVLSSLVVEFEVLTDTPFYFDADFAFVVDTGGTSIAFGSLDAALSGPSGAVFDRSYTFPFPDSFANVEFLSSGELVPGTYTLAVSAQISLDSMAYDIGGDSTASYSLDFSFVPEPSAAALLAGLTVLAGLRRR